MWIRWGVRLQARVAHHHRAAIDLGSLIAIHGGRSYDPVWGDARESLQALIVQHSLLARIMNPELGSGQDYWAWVGLNIFCRLKPDIGPYGVTATPMISEPAE